jgi:hypothetical protein
MQREVIKANIVVFISSFCILVIEIVAGRIMAPMSGFPSIRGRASSAWSLQASVLGLTWAVSLQTDIPAPRPSAGFSLFLGWAPFLFRP